MTFRVRINIYSSSAPKARKTNSLMLALLIHGTLLSPFNTILITSVSLTPLRPSLPPPSHHLPPTSLFSPGVTTASAAVEHKAATSSSTGSAIPAPKPKPSSGAGSKPPPAFKNPLAVSEPTREMLVPGLLVMGASLFSWVAGQYNLSVLVSLGLGSIVYYSIRTLRDRLTQAARIWADRNAQRKRVIGDEESAEWINTVLYRFWQYYEPVLCQNIRDAVQPALDANKPAALSALEFG